MRENRFERPLTAWAGQDGTALVAAGFSIPVMTTKPPKLTAAPTSEATKIRFLGVHTTGAANRLADVHPIALGASNG